MAVTEFQSTDLVTRSNVNEKIQQINALFPVSVANGGTGAETLSSGQILLGNGTNAITSIATLPISKGGTGGTTSQEARENLEVLHAIELYSNSSGTTGTISIATPISLLLYKFLEIYFKLGECYSVKIKPSNGKLLSTTFTGSGTSDSTTSLQFYTTRLSIYDNTIAFHSYYSGYIKGTTEQNTYYNKVTPGVTNIVGYKY